MATRRPSVFKTELYICARKYSIIDSKKKVIFPKINISFFTEDGYFAAPLPEGFSKEEFKAYVGKEIRELPYEKEAVFTAGRIEKCTKHGIYGRFYKDCIHRAGEGYGWIFFVLPSRRIELGSTGLWWYYGCPRLMVDRGEIIDGPKKNIFTVQQLENCFGDIVGSMVILGESIGGVVIGIDKDDEKRLYCITAEALLRELCSFKENIELAIKEGRLPKVEMPEFIIHKGILEKYQGDSETVVVPEGVHTIGEEAFKDNYTVKHLQLPFSLKKIEDSAFDGCLLLQTVNLPDSLKNIGNHAFSLCRSLQEINIPDSVTQIGESAFSCCERLETVVLPKMLKTINDSTFYNCTSLRTISIPETVKSIKEDAFQHCKKLSQVYMSDVARLQNIFAFEHTPWFTKELRKRKAFISKDKIIAVSEKITEYTIPKTVKCIGEFAFAKSNIEELYIPDTVTKIEEAAFSASNIKRIRLPNNLKTIEELTLADCRQLEELIIPRSVTRIDRGALINLPNCIVTILNEAEDNRIFEEAFGWHEHPACVKEVRVHYGSAAMRAARLWNLPCTYIDGVIAPKEYTYLNEDFCCQGTVLVKYLGHQKEVHIPEGITEIDDYAFKYDYSGAEKVFLPDSVHTIGIGAFMHCDSLKEIYGPGVKEIKNSAFCGACHLEKTVFPVVETQDTTAFRWCDALEEKNAQEE